MKKCPGCISLCLGQCARRMSSGGGYVSEARDLFSAMTVAPGAERKGLIDRTIRTLIREGIWGRLDVLWVLAAHDSQAGMLNWKAPGAFTLANGGTAPTFATDRGFTGNGTDGRLVPTWVPNTNGVNYVQDDASLWLWSRTTTGSNSADMGTVGAAAGPSLLCRSSTDLIITRLNGGSTASSSTTISDGSGLIGASRASSSEVKFWRNGAQVGGAVALASTGRGAVQVWACGANATNFSARQQAMAAIGGSLTGLESAFYQSMLPYMQEVGAA